MDADRFDTFTRSLGAPASRRTALGTALAGGLLSAFGLSRTVPEASAAQGGLCTLAFAAQVRQGPSANRPLVAGGAPGELRGNMRFSLSGSGNLQNADLLLDDGSSLPVVGQATGHGFQARITFGQGRALVAVGVGEQDVTRCLGPLDGPATGPEVGDLGEWHGAAGVQNLPGGGSEGGGTRTGGSGNRPAGGSTGTGNRRSGGSTGGSSTGGESGQACPQGQTRCGDSCVDLQSDPVHCGQCGLPCASELGAGACIDGTCACSPGTTRCDDVCVNTDRDPLNCGGCGSECTNSEECFDGACAQGETDCPQGQTRCSGTCVDTTSDAGNCGNCGNVCPNTPEIYNCEGGLCVEPSCAPLTKCNFLCVDVLTNPLHCSACGVACEAGTTCQNGACTVAGGGGCKDGSLTYCGEVAGCVDLNIDPLHCGGCGVACAAGEICQASACTATTGAPAQPTCADQGLIDCFGACVNLQTDPSNCGFCGEVCPSGQCGAGTCIEAVGSAPGCAEGTADCGSGCQYLTDDKNNCGACGNVCGDIEDCRGGVCQLICISAGEPCQPDSLYPCCAGSGCAPVLTGVGEGHYCLIA